MRPIAAGRPGWVLPLLLAPAALGLCLVIAGIVMAARTQSWLMSAAKLDGKVVALQPAGKSAGGGRETYRAIIEATTGDGQALRITDPWTRDPPPPIGSSITLAYTAGKPSEAIVVGFPNLYFVPMMLAGLGAIGAMISLVVALLVKLQWTRRPE